MSEENLLLIEGYIEQIIFRNEQNGYTVLSLSVDDNTVTLVGNMPFVNSGEKLSAKGYWKEHSNFGLQFNVQSYSRTLPTSSEMILKYLSSGIIKGLGPATAEKIVNFLGDDALNILEKNPQKIYEIKGIPKSRCKKIIDELNNFWGINLIMSELDEYGISTEESIRIWKCFGQNSINLINQNPYIICSEGIDIDFEKADLIAQKNSIPIDNINRIKSGIIYIINYNLNNGHTCLPKSKLMEAASKFLNVDINTVENTTNQLISNSEISYENFNEIDFLFSNQMHSAEVYCAQRLHMILKYPPKSITNISNEISNIEKKYSIKYAKMQKLAISQALEKGILVLTGGPGTGKTTTLMAIIDILETNGDKVLLCAPTGRAAQRMSEVTKRDAKTVHRMLEVGWDSNNKPSFHRNESNLLDCDTLIIDELSMVDLLLFEGILRALPLGCRIIMVGDTNQLPSVGAGNVLGDLIDSGIIPTVQLNEIFRQSQKSLIVTNSHKIVQGKMPTLNIKNNDFFFLSYNNPEKIKNTVIDLFYKRLPLAYGYSAINDIQIICPSRKGTLGTSALNQIIQNIINPKSDGKKEIIINGTLLREYDKVMQTKNNYDIYWEKEDKSNGQGIFNGDVGFIIEIDKVTSNIAVRLDDKIAIYSFENARDLQLAYAITVHKSQGNEFNAVIMPLFGSNPLLNYRNLFYTAVTRAKNMIILVGNESTIHQMVKNDKKTKRFSGLKNLLIQ